MGIFNIDLRPLAPFLILAACGAGLYFLWRKFKADAANAADASMYGLPGVSAAATSGQTANASMAAALFGTAGSPAAGTTAANNGYPVSHYVLPGTSGMFGGGQMEGF